MHPGRLVTAERWETVSQPVTRITAAVLCMGSLLLSQVDTAAAKPHDKHPDGLGHWIANGAHGYVIGRYLPGDHFSWSKQSPSGKFLFGEIQHSNGTKDCGWIARVALRISLDTHFDRQACAGQADELRDRSTIGIKFNCRPHVCNSGTYNTKLNHGCTNYAYYNYDEKRHTFRDRIGKRKPYRVTQPVHYRYTTPDKKASMVRDEKQGWVFIRHSCVRGQDLEGGPRLKAFES